MALLLSRRIEDRQDAPGYIDKNSARREGLLIFAAKSSSETRLVGTVVELGGDMRRPTGVIGGMHSADRRDLCGVSGLATG